MKTTKKPFVYLLTNKSNTVIYTGVTSNLPKRISQHKNKIYEGFTSKYNADKLVYYERFTLITEAIKREKQIKGYRREKKVNLIIEKNPTWEELPIPTD